MKRTKGIYRLIAVALVCVICSKGTTHRPQLVELPTKSASSARSSRDVSKLGNGNSEAFWNKVNCVDVTRWKIQQLRQLLTVIGEGSGLLTTSMLPQSTTFSCPQLTIPCAMQKDGKCVIQILQKDICCFSKALAFGEFKSKLILVTQGHDSLGSPVTVHQDHDPDTFKCFNLILNNEKVVTYFVSQHKSNFRHKKLDYLPIGLGTKTLKSELSVENVTRLMGKLILELETNCHENKCTLYPAAVNMNTVGPKTTKERSATFSHAQRVFPSIKNMYGLRSSAEMLEHYARSALVFSPKGTHFDCWRHYEAILMGSIPIVDDHFTLRRILADLPVVFVENWNDLSLEVLEREVNQVLAVNHFALDRLTDRFWQHRFLE